MSEPYWSALGAAPGVLDPAGFGTSLPGSPVDGQEHVLVDSTTAPTYAWRFRYVAAKSSNKWLFVGGSPIIVEILTSETISSGTYGDLATVGPSITLPIAGDYLVRVSFLSADVTSGAGGWMSYAIGGTAASDADGTQGGFNSTSDPTFFSDEQRERKKLALGAVTLTAKYRTASGGTSPFKNRQLKVTPIAVGG